MPLKELFSNVVAKIALKLQTIGTDTTTVGEILDLAGFESLTFAFLMGTITDGTFTVLIEHGDDSGLSDAAAVVDADLRGTEAGASFTATDDDDQVGKIGYIGGKRYVRLSIVSASTSTGAVCGALALLSHKHHLPDETQKQSA